jgi:O-antigen/teichoic acid export membrane protein
MLTISFRSAAWCALLIAGFFTLYSENILRFIWGNQYLASVIPLKILSWSIFFTFVSVLHGAAIVSHGYQRYIIYFCSGTAVFNIILNLLLIPRLGATGAAIATTASYGMGYIFVWAVPDYHFIAVPTWKAAMPLTVPVLLITVKWPGIPLLPQPIIWSALILITAVLTYITFHQGKSLIRPAEVPA